MHLLFYIEDVPPEVLQSTTNTTRVPLHSYGGQNLLPLRYIRDVSCGKMSETLGGGALNEMVWGSETTTVLLIERLKRKGVAYGEKPNLWSTQN